MNTSALQRMMLPHHRRYQYSPLKTRPDYSWPDKKRLAFWVGTNIEVFAFQAGIGHDPTKLGEPQTQRNFAWRDYGNRIGIWRLFDLYEEFGLHTSCLINSYLYDYCPEICDFIRRRGDEFVGHGRTNAERQKGLWEDDERRLIADVTSTIEKHEGKKPKGWLGAAAAETNVTLDLLKEAGYTYCLDWPCDDQADLDGNSVGQNLVPAVSPRIKRFRSTHPSAAFNSRVLRHDRRSVRRDGASVCPPAFGVLPFAASLSRWSAVSASTAAKGLESHHDASKQRSRLVHNRRRHCRLLLCDETGHYSGFLRTDMTVANDQSELSRADDFPPDIAAELGLAALATALRTRKLSSETITRAYLRRIERVDLRIGSYLFVNPRALEDARAMDHKLATGQDLGPLMGLPVAVKQIFSVTGLPASPASRLDVAKLIPPEGPFIAALKRFGIVVLGLTRTTEFAAATINTTTPAPWNPWDASVKRVCGGSSHGSAAAQAAGLCAFAIGSDTGGSVRFPAAMCGVVGFKPSHGRWPTEGVFTLSPTFDTVGVFANTARDVLFISTSLGEFKIVATTPKERLAFAYPREFSLSLDPSVGTRFRRLVEKAPSGKCGGDAD